MNEKILDCLCPGCVAAFEAYVARFSAFEKYLTDYRKANRAKNGVEPSAERIPS